MALRYNLHLTFDAGFRFNSILASPFRVLCSFDDSVRPRQHVRRDREADLLGGLEIEHQIELDRLLYREIGGFCALENLVDEYRGAAKQVVGICSVGHQAAVFDVIGPWIHGRPAIFFGEVNNLFAMGIEESARHHEQRFHLFFSCR